MSPKNMKSTAEWTASFMGDSFLRIARYFRQIQDEDPDQFAIVAKLLGVSTRRAYDLARIDRVFRSHGADENRLSAIGWSKLRLIANRVDKNNLESLLDLAETHSVFELTRLMRDEPLVDGVRYVVLYFEPVQYKVFAEAVLANGGAKSGKGLVGKEAAVIQLIKATAQLDQPNDNGQQ